jgi:hypothetical protein
MRKIVHFVKEWFGGFVFWLYLGCIFYALSPTEQGEVVVIKNSVALFLLISVVGLMIWGIFNCGKILVEEIPNELEKISKWLHDPKNNPEK